MRENEAEDARRNRQRHDRIRHSKLRHPDSIVKAHKALLKEIDKGPNYACTVCHRTMYKESKVELKISVLRKASLVNTCRTLLKIVSGKEWLCKTCQKHLKREVIPLRPK